MLRDGFVSVQLKSDFVLPARSVGQPAGSLPKGNNTILKFAGTVAKIGPAASPTDLWKMLA